MDKKTTMLMILDGFGINERTEGNAVKLANIPNINNLYYGKYPHTICHTSGRDVGLPDGQMGNSEVGHTNIGAGRIVYQELTRITKSIEDGDFFNIPELVEAINNCKEHNSKLHILGLLSDGGVHSHQNHLYGVLELAKRNGIDNTFVHCFLDGRDTPPTSAAGYINELENKMNEIGVGKIATLSGRFYAMDRDKRWERIQKAYNALVLGVGEQSNSASEAINSSYAKQITDEFVVPSVIMENGNPIAKIEENDSIIFFNFRPDRAREITRTIVDPEFSEFERNYFPTYYVTFTNYDETLLPYVHVAFKKEELKNTFGELISNLGKTQLRIAETEKYAHVTFFFNGGVEEPYPGEDRILVPSPKVETYDLQPEMSCYEVCDKVVDAINSRKYDAIILNFANPDMVGHTGVIPACIKALESLDGCVGRIVEAIEKNDGNLVAVADHGNIEQLIDYETGQPHTAHTTNPVPLALVTSKPYGINEGRLADLAPTLLDLMEIEKPVEMTGNSLLKK